MVIFILLESTCYFIGIIRADAPNWTMNFLGLSFSKLKSSLYCLNKKTIGFFKGCSTSNVHCINCYNNVTKLPTRTLYHQFLLGAIAFTNTIGITG